MDAQWRYVTKYELHNLCSERFFDECSYAYSAPVSPIYMYTRIGFTRLLPISSKTRIRLFERSDWKSLI